MNKPENNRTPVTLGFNIAVGIGVFSFIGYWIDIKGGTQPKWTVFFVMMGLIYAGYEVWKFVKYDQRGGDDDDKNV